MYRFDPRRYAISFHAENRPNSHGIAFDYWGYHYATDGTSGRTYQVRPEENGFKMYELFEKEVRPVAANAIISSRTTFRNRCKGILSYVTRSAILD